jgi:para-aminobenzoate synthetase/4-amino-4-deoxychorismate lyase
MTLPKSFSDKALHSILAGVSGKESFVFLESTRVSPENHNSFLFRNPLDRIVCMAGDDPVHFFRKAQNHLKDGFYLAGYLGYELGYLLEPRLADSFRPRLLSGCSRPILPMADMGVFQRPFVYDHLAASLSDGGTWPSETGTKTETEFTLTNLRLNLGKEEYLEAISRVKAYIAAGDTYQVNYTLKLLFDFSGSIIDFYCSLRRNQSVAYGGFIQNNDTSILTFSPELFFRKKENAITVRPMKGTMHRGRTAAEDSSFAIALHQDIKNRSENVMIVDLLRNDLGRLSRMGGVHVQSLFDVETYETLHQMTSSIRGTLDHAISLEEMFKALFPCGSVTGAPKIRTMEIIRELEVEDRGVYTGAIGYISPVGDAVFNVPIRTVVLQGSQGEMGIGSGIVWDSDPVDEWEECKLKGRFLTTPAPEFKLIETLLWQAGSGYWLLDQHLQRLAESAGYFFFRVDLAKIRQMLQRLEVHFHSFSPPKNQRLRVLLSRQGEIELTYSELAEASLRESNPASLMLKDENLDLPRAVFASRKTDSRSPYLFHKTTLRDLYDEERADADARGYYEVFFVNEKGEVTEGSYTNIFLQKDGRLITPPVSCGLLPGVLRKHLLQQFPELVVEKPFTRRELERADAVYVGNSVRGLVRVRLE